MLYIKRPREKENNTSEKKQSIQLLPPQLIRQPDTIQKLST